MSVTHVFKTREEWLEHKAKLQAKHKWSDDHDPESYPAIAVVTYEYDHRYAQNKMCFEFVHLNDFLGSVPRNVWHVYLLPNETQSLATYMGEAVPSYQPPDGMLAFLFVDSSAAVHVARVVEQKFVENGLEIEGRRPSGDPIRLLLTQNRLPDYDVEYLE